MPVTWETHLNKKYLYLNYEGHTPAELLDLIDVQIKEIQNCKGQVYVLSNVKNTIMSPEFMKKAKEEGKKYVAKVEKSAIIGVTGLKRILVQSYISFTGSKFKLFETKEEALDYLFK